MDIKKTKDTEELQNTNQGPVDYGVYTMAKKEKLFYIAVAALALFVLGYIFYHNIIVALVITPFSLFYPKIRTKEIINNRQNALNLQFKDLLYSISSSLASGKALETSFKEASKELEIIYPNEETFIIKEVQYMSRRLEMNEQIENLLQDFALRSHLDDVHSFSNVLQLCNKRGGNIMEIIRNTSNVINDKIEVKLEITTVLSQKRFEQKVLSIMPIALIVFLSLTQKDYMEPVFTTPIGRVIMTVAIIFIVVGYLITRKIMDIKI